MKFRKKEINTTIQENKISCWDIAGQEKFKTYERNY